MLITPPTAENNGFLINGEKKTEKLSYNIIINTQLTTAA
jgi:hypothetical protein